MINLLPPTRLHNLRLARSNTVLRRYVEFMLLGIALIIIAVSAAYYLLNIQQKNVQSTVRISQTKIRKLEPVQKQAEQLNVTVNTIAGLLARNVKFSDMLTQIGGVMPQGSVLTGLQFSIEDLKSPLVISAQVDTEQKAAILRNNLASSPLFSKVTIQSISQYDPQPTVGAPATQDSPYKFTTVLKAYLKPQTGVRR